MKTLTEKCVITRIERKGYSNNGNPTYRVFTSDGRSWLTGQDAQVGYAISNYVRRNPEDLRVVELTIRNSRIIGAEWAKED
jgi:hypothetical protein